MSFYPQTKHPGLVFCPFICQTFLWAQQSGSRSTSSSTGVQGRTERGFILSRGFIPAQIKLFLMPESAQWQQGCYFLLGYFVSAFGFGRIYPTWALRNQNYFLPVVKRLCALRLYMKERILITFNFKPLMGCDHSRAPSREFVAKEKKNHPKISLISWKSRQEDY